MTHRPYTPPAWQAKPLADGRVTLLVVPLKVQPFTVEGVVYTWTGKDSAFLCGPSEVSANLMKHGAAQYAPGDLIWCREAYIGAYAYEVNEYKPKDWGNKPSWFPADGPIPERFVGQFWHKARSPVTMPKWAARTWLRCTGVEVRRVQTISEGEAWAVGCPKGDPTDNGGWFPKEELQPDGSEMGWDCPEDWVADKWDAQHTDKPRKRAGGTLPPKPAVDLSFDANPWAAFVAVEKISKEDV